MVKGCHGRATSAHADRNRWGLNRAALGALRGRSTFLLGCFRSMRSHALFCSIVVGEVPFGRILPGSLAVLAIVLVEAYWIIPKWDAHHRPDNGLRQ